MAPIQAMAQFARANDQSPANLRTVSRRFADASYRVQRARPYFAELRGDLSAYRARKPYEVTQEYDRASGEYIVRGVVCEEPMPIISLIAGDIVHSLRVSLDYAMWDMLSGKPGVRDADIYFPVARTRAKKVGSLLKALNAISPLLVAEVERLQPYNSARAPEAKSLEVLHGLDIEDKHHRLNILGGAIFTPESFMTVPAGIGLVITSNIFDNGRIYLYPFEDGTEVMRYRIPRSSSQVDVGARLVPEIAFGRGSVAEGEPVYKTLDALLTFTTGLLDRLQSAFP